ncbi:amino acid ABC transporter permease [Brucella tritici]|uniref:amino acid ABC transporter permease n=1 Tax=Brucella tritici TaxID=94626 RepID=UPI00124C2DE3|nr:amino acid ABC transporter permease [Brucella tritici]KAB2679628.1 amino acid ABC transporter permease [Brucella tritici]
MDILSNPDFLARIATGLYLTVILAFASWFIAMASGILLAVVRIVANRAVDAVVALWIEYQRNVPVLVHIFAWYFGISTLLPYVIQDWMNAHGGDVMFAALAIGLYYGAYVCEDIRSGYRSIPTGQYEAARTIGLTFWQSTQYVMLPQALRASTPALVSRAILLLKSTSIAMVIGVMELTYQTKEIYNETFRVFAIFSVATIIYFLLSLIIIALGNVIERFYAVRVTS